jgi:protein SCO1/2
MLRILVVGLVMLVAALMLMPRPDDLLPAPAVATELPEPRPLPPVTLTDHHGNAFSLESLTGRPTLAFFGFTHCPDICPLSLAAIAGALGEMRADNVEPLPQVLFVSVDPERDSPERIRAYLQNFDAEFIGATGQADELAPLLEALSVTVHRQVLDDASYTVTHNGTIYVLDSQVRWAALFGGTSHDTRSIADDYAVMRRKL